MKKNVGNYDQLLRVIVGILIAGAGIYFNSYLGLLALLPLATAYLRWCPAYVPLKVSTCPKERTGSPK